MTKRPPCRLIIILWNRLRQSARHLWKWFGRFLSWFLLEDINQAADLGVKCAAIFGAFVAANFFILQPELSRTAEFESLVDPDKVREIYSQAGKKVPDIVENLVVGNEGGIIGWSGRDTFYYFSVNAGSIFGGRVTTSSTPDPALVEQLYHMFSSENKEPPVSTPPEIVTIDMCSLTTRLLGGSSPSELADGDKAFAEHTIHDACYGRLTVTVTNRGRATAHQVVVNVPEGYQLKTSSASAGAGGVGFELPPGGPPATLVYQTEAGNVPASQEVSQPGYNLDSSAWADSAPLQLIAYILSGFWVACAVGSSLYHTHRKARPLLLTSGHASRLRLGQRNRPRKLR